MQFRRVMLFTGVVFLAGVMGREQRASAQAPPESPNVIRTETRLVLVDTVVTDKKGEYVRDLTQKEFRVWEDNKEQTIKNFSFEADPSSPNNSQKHYLVLFFDNSTMQPGDQVQARQAAGKFIDKNTGPNKLIAIVNFGGSVRIAQNFTSDAERLKQVVSGVKTSAVNPNAAPVEVASVGMPSLGNAEADFGARSVMLALRSMAKSLATVPGRKILVLLTSGFPLTEEVRSELTATIDACNRSNVAIYPIDVRGLVAGTPMAEAAPSNPVLRAGSSYPSVRLIPASFHSYGASFLPQHAGGGAAGGGGGGTGGGGGGGHAGGTGGGTGGGGTGGGKGGGTGGGTGGGKGGGTSGGNSGGGRAGGGGSTQPQSYINNPYSQARQIIPPFPTSATTNQEVMYALAAGTGGFLIANTNDLLGGLEKIGREQNEYYILGYVPTDTPEGTCHTLKVKVDRSGTTVRARSGYCNVKPVDLLAGNATEKELESRVSGATAGNIGASMQVPYFYSSPNTARLNVAMEIPSDSITFEKNKGKFHAAINILGIAYRADGGVGARFSDTAKIDLENKKELEAFKEKPLHYEYQFEVAPGQYKLKVAFSSGGAAFGKLEMPLTVDPYDGKQFVLSAVALSKEFHRTNQTDGGLDTELLEGRTPLVSRGMQITPAGSNHFKKSDPAALYLEIYEPGLLTPKPPDVGIELKVVDRKTGESKQDTGVMKVTEIARPDNPVIPIALKLPVESLTAGSYRVELQAMDSTGRSTTLRSADFEVE